MTRAPLRIAFMGSPDFAVPALHALHAAGHVIAAVYTQPPRPAGRGQAERACPVHVAARALGLVVRHPASLRHDTAAHQAFADLDLDVAVVAAYGLILPPAMLAAPRRGCLNIHASLLPAHRGASPIQAAILAGDHRSGITIMRMDQGLDTGPILLMQMVACGDDVRFPWLHDRLAAMSAEAILQALDADPPGLPQPASGHSYAPKLTREDGRLDWSQPGRPIDCRVRALNPWPGTWTLLDGQMLKVLDGHRSEASGHGAAPGTTLSDDLLVQCAPDEAFIITRLQAAGRKPMQAAEFLRGRPVPAGTVLG